MPLTTEALSARLGGRPKAQSIRSAYCRLGHYFGLVPDKLPSGQLAWPDDAVERLLAAARKREAVR